MNALTESAPAALPPQLNPTTNLRALSADDAVERLSQVPASSPTAPLGSAPAVAPLAPARRPLTRYAAAALAAALALLAAVLLASR